MCCGDWMSGWVSASHQAYPPRPCCSCLPLCIRRWEESDLRSDLIAVRYTRIHKDTCIHCCILYHFYQHMLLRLFVFFYVYLQTSSPRPLCLRLFFDPASPSSRPLPPAQLIHPLETLSAGTPKQVSIYVTPCLSLYVSWSICIIWVYASVCVCMCVIITWFQIFFFLVVFIEGLSQIYGVLYFITFFHWSP